MHETTSVFGKLVAIMLAMALALLLLVGLFFLAYVGPNLNRSVSDALHESAVLLASTSPDYATAKRLSARAGIRIRYEGPKGSWSTNPHLPTIETVRRRGWHGFAIVPAPDGGNYLFAQDFMAPLRTAHQYVLYLLLALMIAVVVTTHAVIRHLLRPLRDLGDGVAQLSNGQLDVVVPRRTRDEFGTLTDAFNTMVDRVRTMIRARDQLLVDVSHELRSPVTRMKVALELLPDDDRKAHMAADLSEMELMIGELLELERLREGRLRKVRQDIVPILESVCRDARLVNTPPQIVADVEGEKLRIVVRNLVENAIKYSLPDSRPVEVSASEGAGHVTIRVVDDGVGIPESDLQTIFEPFFRVDRSRSRKTGGYGLGLSISKRIVEAHGGTIAATNNPGRGTTFTVILPT